MCQLRVTRTRVVVTTDRKSQQQQHPGTPADDDRRGRLGVRMFGAAAPWRAVGSVTALVCASEHVLNSRFVVLLL